MVDEVSAIPARAKGDQEALRQCGVNPGYLLRLVQRIRRTELCQHCGQPLKDRK